MLYMFILGAAVQFIHFAVRRHLAVASRHGLDTAMAIGCAALSFRTTRPADGAPVWLFGESNLTRVAERRATAKLV
jgi:hypothetical protein